MDNLQPMIELCDNDLGEVCAQTVGDVTSATHLLLSDGCYRTRRAIESDNLDDGEE